MLKVLRACNGLLQHAEETFAAFGLLATSLIVFLNVVLRYGFQAGVSWSDELVRYLMIWVTFVGASICVREGLHVGIDFLVDRLKGAPARVVQTGIHLIGLLFSYYLITLGLEAVRFVRMTGQVSPAMQAPMWVVYLILPIGGGLMCLRYLQALVRIWRPSAVSRHRREPGTEGSTWA